MLKRESLNVVAVMLVVFVAAGCAQQNVVKKDEGFAVTKQAQQSTPAVAPLTSAATAPALPASSQSAKVSAQGAQDAVPLAQLQSALEKIYFDFDSANLSESARNTLSKNAAALARKPSAAVRIEGNCDERGSAEYNLALGERRARSAQQYLITLGVKPERLSIISYGKEKPAVRGSEESAWNKNRRDEFIVVDR